VARPRPWIVIFTCVCLVTVTSCTTTMRVHWWPDESNAIVEDAEYRVETKGGRVYVTDRLSQTDSTFVIRSLKEAGGRGVWGSRGHFVDVDAIAVHARQVRSIEKTGREEFLVGSTESTNSSYRIRTVDGAEYRSGRFTKTDSTLTIHELFIDGKRNEVEPVTLSLGDLQSVETVELNRGRTSLVLIGSGFVVVAITVLTGFSLGD
jgi:hypothetical protein